MANAELERLANLDGLTGIANHRYFDHILEVEWRRCRRDGRPLSVVMLDVDFFKRFNDRYGHQAGDECLKAIATVLGESVHRAGDLAARYGGEEFVLVLSATPAEGALHVAETVRRRVQELAIEHDCGDGVGVVTLSAGVVTVLPDSSLELTTVIGRADEALYQANRRGRNRVEVWRESAEPN
jgi:two-component system chemotaxis family response regulator WspR